MVRTQQNVVIVLSTQRRGFWEPDVASIFQGNAKFKMDVRNIRPTVDLGYGTVFIVLFQPTKTFTKEVALEKLSRIAGGYEAKLLSL